MKDILLVLSDQHSRSATCFAQPWMDTPCLRTIAEAGAVFPHTYCNAPLCVPSRMSFLSGLYPHQTGIFNNDATLPGDIPTIAHAIGAAGYHTVLVGRMHFKGEEQHHGFDERLVGDITSQYWGGSREDMGAYQGTAAMKGCRRLVGAGCSPVMAYDDMVTEAALEYLNREHTQPLFMVVGLYSPHFPYVTEAGLYEKYRQRVPMGGAEPKPRDCYSGMVQVETPERTQRIRAAYCGMVERMDGQVGMLYDRFFSTPSRGESGVFLYTSDHGDQCGRRGLFGKQTLYEDAVNVPLLLCGKGIPHGQFEDSVSLLDVSATLVELAGAQMPTHRGHSLLPMLGGEVHTRRPVLIQHMLETRELPHLLQAAVQYPYKLVQEVGQTALFQLEDDPQECRNLGNALPEVTSALLTTLLPPEEAAQCEVDDLRQLQCQQLLKAWGKAKHPPESARIIVPETAKQPPTE